MNIHICFQDIVLVKEINKTGSVSLLATILKSVPRSEK